VLPLGGPVCDCGSTGCLEALASGRAIVRRARQALEASGAIPPDWAVEDLTASAIADAARAGDLLAGRLWQETVLYLSVGVSNVINVLDPDAVVIGGGVAAGAGELLFEPLRRAVRERCMPSLARATPILPAALGPEVGIVGAAGLAMEQRLADI
jgi:glucokinase